MARLRIPIWRIFNAIGVPPNIWLIPNTFKIYEYGRLLEGANLRSEHVALDFGCGKGVQTLNLARRCKRVVGIDTSESKIRTARRFVSRSSLKNRSTFLCERIQDADLPAESFDRVFSFSVLEHCEDLDSIFERFHALLGPGGEIHASVDTLATIDDERIVAKHREDHGVVQYFDALGLRERVEKHGFEVFELFPILTGDYGRTEFERRVLDGHRIPPYRRYPVCRRFLAEDRKVASDLGIMLIFRARKT